MGRPNTKVCSHSLLQRKSPELAPRHQLSILPLELRLHAGIHHSPLVSDLSPAVRIFRRA